VTGASATSLARLFLSAFLDGWPSLALALAACLMASTCRRLPRSALAAGAASAAVAATLLLLWRAWRAGTAGGENLATLTAAYLPPAVLLIPAVRSLAATAPWAARIVGAARDLAFLTALAVAIVVVNGLALAVPDHALVFAGLRLSVWLLLAGTLDALGRETAAPHVLRRMAVAALLPTVEPLAALLAGGANPLLSGFEVGLLPIANALLPGYLVPALLLARLARGRPAGERIPSRLAGGAAALMVLLWTSLELRRAFHGAVLSGPLRPGEGLALVLIWAGLATVFAGGSWIRRRRRISSRRSRA